MQISRFSLGSGFSSFTSCSSIVSPMNQAKEYEYFIPSEEADEVERLLVEPQREQVSVDDILCSRDDNLKQGIVMKDISKGWPAAEVENISRLNGIDATQFQVEGGDPFPTMCDDYLQESVTASDYNPIPRERQNFIISGSEDLIMDFIYNDGLHLDNAISKINGNLGHKYDVKPSVEAIWLNYPNPRSETVEKLDENGANSITDLIETNSTKYSNSGAIPRGPRQKRLRKTTWRSVEESPDISLRPCRKRPNQNDNVRIRDVGFCDESFCKAIQVPFSPREQKELKKKRVSTAMRTDDDELSSLDKSEEECSTRVKSCGGSRKHRMVWSHSEVSNLLDGISQHGFGKWALIKKFRFSSSSHRTPVDLKDKWRTLVKASSAQLHSKAEDEQKRNQAGRYLPKSILHRVSELAAKNPYPKTNNGRKFNCSRQTKSLPTSQSGQEYKHL